MRAVTVALSASFLTTAVMAQPVGPLKAGPLWLGASHDEVFQALPDVVWNVTERDRLRRPSSAEARPVQFADLKWALEIQLDERGLHDAWYLSEGRAASDGACRARLEKIVATLEAEGAGPFLPVTPVEGGTLEQRSKPAMGSLVLRGLGMIFAWVDEPPTAEITFGPSRFSYLDKPKKDFWPALKAWGGVSLRPDGSYVLVTSVFAPERGRQTCNHSVVLSRPTATP